ncbi:MAG: hypothetical protein V1698_00810 [bacterium]
MSIKDFWEKFGENIAIFGIVLTAVGIAFLVGRISVLESNELPIQIRSSLSENTDLSDSVGAENLPPLQETEKPRYGMYCASKNSDIYHLWNCPSVARIKDENKIWFDLEEEAKETGRKPASDCLGE